MDMQSRFQIRKNFNYDELEMTRNTLIKAKNYAAQVHLLELYLLSKYHDLFSSKIEECQLPHFLQECAYTIYRYKKYNTPELRNSQIIQISGPEQETSILLNSEYFQKKIKDEFLNIGEQRNIVFVAARNKCIRPENTVKENLYVLWTGWRLFNTRDELIKLENDLRNYSINKYSQDYSRTRLGNLSIQIFEDFIERYANQIKNSVIIITNARAPEVRSEKNIILANTEYFERHPETINSHCSSIIIDYIDFIESKTDVGKENSKNHGIELDESFMDDDNDDDYEDSQISIFSGNDNKYFKQQEIKQVTSYAESNFVEMQTKNNTIVINSDLLRRISESTLTPNGRIYAIQIRKPALRTPECLIIGYYDCNSLKDKISKKIELQYKEGETHKVYLVELPKDIYPHASLFDTISSRELIYHAHIATQTFITHEH